MKFSSVTELNIKNPTIINAGAVANEGIVVKSGANKVEIKKACEEVLGVKVASVNTMHVTGKIKRMGRFAGRRASWKKAIVTLAKDSKTIEFFEM